MPSSRNEPHYVLRLFVSGTTARSVRAIENLQRLCETRLKDRYTLEIVDIYQTPELAREYQIFAVPTLLKMEPEPTRRIIGDLTDTDRLLQGLSLSAAQPSSGSVGARS